ncbi:FAD-dependent oxidoreductase [Argonema antarcticum]|uniref:FAD-dependent oxidoreductase n=1 Tax=Argonema antarcticum TaxID=2942763 RepID=UPI00201281AF|nr:FAD-dependent oxidoreductase [Argonema antarcticum]MCL1473534.1 FAD-binding oxidoreductase [Argonema antarcticum A004/B2]
MSINLDVLIVGGGVQGLWLLNDLTGLGYSVLLLTKDPLGQGQTLHSQLRIQGGHSFSDEPLVRRFREATNEHWRSFIERYPEVRAFGDSRLLFLYRSNERAIEQEETWRNKYQLNFQQYQGNLLNNLPEATSDSGIVLESDETWLDGQRLIAALISTTEVRQQICHGEVTEIILNNGSVQKVRAMVNGNDLSFKPKCLVLAAGDGNKPLLDNTIDGNKESLFARFNNFDNKNYTVLVVKGNIPPLTGFFQEFGGLQIFSRMVDENEIVWLVPYEGIESRLQNEVEKVTRFLSQLRPSRSQQDLLWGFYTGRKVEVTQEIQPTGRGRKIAVEAVETCGVGNLFVALPSWLTLAPVVSRRIVDQITESIAPTTQMFNLQDHGLSSYNEIALERWRTVDCSSWKQFREDNQLEEVY